MSTRLIVVVAAGGIRGSLECLGHFKAVKDRAG